MPKASVKRLIECNKRQLIDLVLDIENYPSFIPYCLNSKVYEKKEKENIISIIADLTIGHGAENWPSYGKPHFRWRRSHPR